MKKLILCLVFVFVLFSLVACGNNNPEEQKPDESKTITLSVTEVKVKEGETYKFDIPEKVGVQVLDKEVLSINKDTLTITGLKAGSTTVVFYLVDNSSVEARVTVTVEAKEVVKQKYTITYDLDGGTCEGLVKEFEEGAFPALPVPTKDGFKFLGWFENDTEVSSITENKNYTLKAKWEEEIKEILPETIEITVDCEDSIIYSDSVCFISYKVLPEGASQELTYRNLNKSKATLTEEFQLIPNGSGECTIVFTSAVDPEVKASVTLPIKQYMNPERFVESIVVKSEDLVVQDIKAYDTTAGYDTYLLGSVVTMLFEDITVIEKLIDEGAYNRPGKVTDEGNAFNLKYICVHDVGGAGNSLQTTNYGRNPGGREVSWHYTVGNDGIYQLIPDDEMGWHAGDGTWDPMVWYDSGILAPEGDDTPAKITVNQTTGKFQINGEDTQVTAPTNNGKVVPNSQLPYTGINNYVDMSKTSSTYRHYMIGKTYYNTTYNTLSNRGGNLCSIGIESTVNKGSNMFYTWELLAKLVGAKLLVGHGLLPRDVKQHNTFSGKNCPQTMRQAGRWETFMKYVETEFYFKNSLSNFKIEFSTTDVKYLKSNGMINKLPDEPTEVSFSIRLYSTKENVDFTKEYKVTLPAKTALKNFQ